MQRSTYKLELAIAKPKKYPFLEFPFIIGFSVWIKSLYLEEIRYGN